MLFRRAGRKIPVHDPDVVLAVLPPQPNAAEDPNSACECRNVEEGKIA